MRLEGKVALISGAARGQGETEARLFAQEGASVVLGDILESEGEAAAAAIGESGGNARFIALDVTSESDWVSAVRFTVETFGRLDILINNAAIYSRTNIVDTDIEEWRRIMDINMTGVFLGTKHAVPGHARVRGRLDHQHILNSRTRGQREGQRVRSIQGRREALHQVHGHTARLRRNQGKLCSPRPDRYGHDRRQYLHA